MGSWTVGLGTGHPGTAGSPDTHHPVSPVRGEALLARPFIPPRAVRDRIADKWLTSGESPSLQPPGHCGTPQLVCVCLKLGPSSSGFAQQIIESPACDISLILSVMRSEHPPPPALDRDRDR